MIDSPLFVMERDKLIANLSKLAYLQEQTGVKILHTLKSFNEDEGLELIANYLSGFSAGNQREMESVTGWNSEQIHSYAPAFRVGEVEVIARQSSTMSFNSLNQWESYADLASAHCSIGLRINPKLTLKQPKYCNPNRAMRLGIPQQSFLKAIERNPEDFEQLEGLHFHVFCWQELSGLKYLINHIEKHYHDVLPRLKWLNLGGGHQLTSEQYDREGFITLVNEFSQKHPHLTIILEPGESVVKDTGYFVTTILDITTDEESQTKMAILDTSIEAHLLDIAITKQIPRVRETLPHPTPHHYQLSGMSCIAGDIIGEYYFGEELAIGDKVIFEDMMGYSMVKQTEFNGIKRAGFRLD